MNPILAALYAAAAAWSAAAPFLVPSLSLGPFSAAQLPYWGLAALHGLYGAFLLFRRARAAAAPPQKPPFGPELLFAYALLLFLFTYIFASNANLDYVQRFVQSGGNLRLALNTAAERAAAAARYAPFLLLNLGVYGAGRLRGPRAAGEKWFLPRVLLSSAAATLAFPSFAFVGGLGFLGWVCLVPLLTVLYEAGTARGVFYGTLYGAVTSTLVNYWLGTFSLVSLQIIILIQLAYYFCFMLVFVPAVRTSRRELRFLVAACLWTVFESLRSAGFLGYPWGLLGASQWSFTPVIQIASLAGVWGVSFLVLLVNAAAAEMLLPGDGGRRRLLAPAAAGGLFALSLLYGSWVLTANPPAADGIRVALVQQNSDPRKHDYRETFDALVRLTDQAVEGKPDLVVWSETAFVPNIRRWSREDPAASELAVLVRDFLAYQKSLGTWLVTGNDDYDFRAGSGGREERVDYNAAVLFSPEGERTATYHKNKLVPFTEYFPYRNILPRIHETLLAFDVHFWEPGREATVFRHPEFSFSTPICFEDVFPWLVRRFVRGGADLIINLSNDYWSLTDAEAMQHAVHALFRAVENRRPLLRATASGLTMEADAWGRIGKRLPFYEEGFLVARPAAGGGPLTPYTRWGDWFPAAAAFAAAVMTALSPRRRQGLRFPAPPSRPAGTAFPRRPVAGRPACPVRGRS